MEAHTKKVMAARTALVLDQPFFGVLALRLRILADPGCKTAWVDGVTLGYEPSFVEDLTHAALVALIAHEVMHCACGHPWRRDLRDPKKWNVACDYAINGILDKSGFTLPEGGLLDPAMTGNSSEWIYARLPEPEPNKGNGDEPKGMPGETCLACEQDLTGQENPSQHECDNAQDNPQGEVRDAPDDAAENDATEGEWKAAVQQAANAADAQGKLASSLKRFASDAVKPKVDWRSTLRRFVQEVTSADYTWTRPNRRYLSRGLYMPELHSESTGPIAIGIDTSGSIDDVTIAQFAAEVRSIIDESDPARVHVMYCDSMVHRTDTFEREDLLDFDALDPIGGGGTRFEPVFEAVEELDEPPVCIIYLTDLMGSFPREAPEIPTLWATTYETGVPFGETLLISD